MADKRKVVAVDWVDSASYAKQCWRDMAEYEALTPSVITTVGFIAAEDKARVVLVQTVNDDNDASGCMAIPRGCIRKIRRLRG